MPGLHDPIGVNAPENHAKLFRWLFVSTNNKSSEHTRFLVSLGTIPELPAESCEEIKASEGEKAVSGKYCLDSIEPGNVTLAYCNMAAYNMSTEDELLTG